jgi:hypothetical protein
LHEDVGDEEDRETELVLVTAEVEVLFEALEAGGCVVVAVDI